MKHTLHLLIIHYDNPHALEEALSSFLGKGVVAECIYVFDNASSQANKDKLAQLVRRTKVNAVYSDENLGWGKAVNQFISSRPWSDNDVLGISAHDAQLIKADWDDLDEEFLAPTVLFVCPQYPAPLRCKFSVARSFRCKPALDSQRVVAVVGHATLCFVRPSVIAHLPFDESCFIYGCESEIFLRAHDAGYKTIITNRIIVVNPITDSPSEFCALAFAINSIYIAKLRHGLFGYLVRMLVVAISMLRLGLQGRWSESATKCKALFFSLRTGGAGFREFLRWNV
jgi:GT2 family glycosyltransferase